MVSVILAAVKAGGILTLEGEEKPTMIKENIEYSGHEFEEEEWTLI